MQRVVFRAANSSKTVSDQAFELMSTKMGQHGPDVLYELWVAGGTRATKAEKRLSEPEVFKRGSAALQIAVDMRKAKGCKAKGELLERATDVGDERVVTILKPLCTAARRGCGFLGLSACAARCRAQAAAMKQTIAAIQRRKKK
jgi:hypothetical protein